MLENRKSFFLWKYEDFPEGVHAVGRPPAYLNPIRIYIGFPGVRADPLMWAFRIAIFSQIAPVAGRFATQ